MRIVPFPGRDVASPDEAWSAELEAALNGDAAGSGAERWRELRSDVRALAPPIAAEFELELEDLFAEARPAWADTEMGAGAGSGTGTDMRPDRTLSRPPSQEADRRIGWPHLRGRRGALAIGAAVSAVIAGLLIAGTRQAATPPQARPQAGPAKAAESSGPSSVGTNAARGQFGDAQVKAAQAVAPQAPAAANGAAAAPGHVQQLSASISLAPSPSHVQETADRVARLAVGVGGFVQSSHVQVQQGGASEANIMLKLPSTRLSTALASIGQLAPVRAESQSLQDITDAFDAARRRLADATAERQALLRALAAATTQGQIDSLRERLSQVRSAIAEARSTLQAVSQRAGTAEVEVTVLGDARTGSEGLTLHRALHDAERVLIGAFAAILIAASIVVPVALLFVVLVSGGRAWRRYRRERALDAP